MHLARLKREMGKMVEIKGKNSYPGFTEKNWPSLLSSANDVIRFPKQNVLNEIREQTLELGV